MKCIFLALILLLVLIPSLFADYVKNEDSYVILKRTLTLQYDKDTIEKIDTIYRLSSGEGEEKKISIEKMTCQIFISYGVTSKIYNHIVNNNKDEFQFNDNQLFITIEYIYKSSITDGSTMCERFNTVDRTVFDILFGNDREFLRKSLLAYGNEYRYVSVPARSNESEMPLAYAPVVYYQAEKPDSLLPTDARAYMWFNADKHEVDTSKTYTVADSALPIYAQNYSFRRYSTDAEKGARTSTYIHAGDLKEMTIFFRDPLDRDTLNTNQLAIIELPNSDTFYLSQDPPKAEASTETDLEATTKPVYYLLSFLSTLAIALFLI